MAVESRGKSDFDSEPTKPTSPTVENRVDEEEINRRENEKRTSPVKAVAERDRSSIREDEIIDRRMATNDTTHKRYSNKIPAPVRPVSMISGDYAITNDSGACDRKMAADEPDRVVYNRSRSSSVSNRNRRRASPPPLDRVLQIQATDKILNKNEVYRDEEKRGRNRDTKVTRKESVSNIVISSGIYHNIV